MSLLIGALFGAALTPLAALEFVHMFQLEGYVQRNYYQWIKAHLPACALPLPLYRACLFRYGSHAGNGLPGVWRVGGHGVYMRSAGRY